MLPIRKLLYYLHNVCVKACKVSHTLNTCHILEQSLHRTGYSLYKNVLVLGVTIAQIHTRRDTFLPSFRPTDRPTYLPTYRPKYLLIQTDTYIIQRPIHTLYTHTYITYIHTYTHTNVYIHTYTHTYIHIHTYMPTYMIHAHMHTRIHTNVYTVCTYI